MNIWHIKICNKHAMKCLHLRIRYDGIIPDNASQFIATKNAFDSRIIQHFRPSVTRKQPLLYLSVRLLDGEWREMSTWLNAFQSFFYHHFDNLYHDQSSRWVAKKITVTNKFPGTCSFSIIVPMISVRLLLLFLRFKQSILF